MKLEVALPAPVHRPDSPYPLSHELRWLSGFSFPNLKMAWRVQLHSPNGEISVENNDPRREHGATMDTARPALGTMGCIPQIGLAEIPLQEWETQMRGGRKRRDVRRSGRRKRSRRNDERWRRVHRLRRIHEARVGNAGETAPALDSQIYGVFLVAKIYATSAFL